MIIVDDVIELLKEGRVFPKNNMIYFLRDKKKEMSDGGIALPSTKYVSENWGTVYAVPDKVLDPITKKKYKPKLKKGDRVFICPKDGEKFNELDTLWQRSKYSDVEAKLDKNANPVPMARRVFVKQKAIEEVMESGLIIATNVSLVFENDEWVAKADKKRRNGEGQIIALGHDLREDLKVGDNILFDEDQGTTLRSDDNETVLIIKEENIYCVNNEEN